MMVKTQFKIPLQTEVEAYIKEKKGWPQTFCRFYAERFWNFYQSNGWKVSGRAAMKDWKAAFNSNWQNLKYAEDIAFLNKCMAKEPTAPEGTKEIAFLNSCLSDYKTKWDKISDVDFAHVYDFMKERRLIKMTQEEKENAKAFCNGNVVKGKALAVRMIFDRMITNNQNFR